MTLFYKAIFPGRIETRSTQTRTYVACLVVTWATERGAGGYVTWCGTYARASAEAERELARGRNAEIAEAIEIDAAEVSHPQGRGPARAPAMRHRQPSTFQKSLAAHLVNTSRRVPKTAIGRLGHLIIGIVLGAVVAAVVIVWMTGAPRWPSSPA
jgi:hypothetical protein